MSSKIPLELSQLPPTWKAFVHRRKSNRVFFCNSETKQSLWLEEFVAYYGHILHGMSPEFIRTLAKEKVELKTTSSMIQVCNDDQEEPMETDEITKELSDFRTSFNGVKADGCHDWSAMAGVLDELQSNTADIAVFDTSSLLNCIGILETSLQKQVTCVIPCVVIRELDGLKKNHKESLKRLAFSAVAKLHEHCKKYPDGVLIESSIESERDLYLPNSSGQLSLFIAKNSDDWIIKTALTIQAKSANPDEHFSAGKVMLITDDRIMDMKARSFGLSSYQTQEFMKGLSNSCSTSSSLVVNTNKERSSSQKQGPDVVAPLPVQKKKKKQQPAYSLSTPSFKAKEEVNSRKKQVVRDMVEEATSSRPAKKNKNKNKRKSNSNKPKNQFISTFESTSLGDEFGDKLLPESARFELQSHLHPQDWIFNDEASKLMFIMKNSVEVAVDAVMAKKPGSDARKVALDKLAEFCERFLNGGCLQPDFIAAVGLFETLYSSTITLLADAQKIERNALMQEVSRGGLDCECVASLRSFVEYMKRLGWKPSEVSPPQPNTHNCGN